jgi:type IV secretory pathway VirB10-like protein
MATTPRVDSPQNEPELRKRMIDPRGVLQKNLKPLLYLGAALLVILAALFSSQGNKGSSQRSASKSVPPQPALQDNTDNNIQDLKNQLDAERHKQAEQALLAASVAAPAPHATIPAYSPNGEPPSYSHPQAEGAQPSPEEQARQQLAAKERERAFESRFSSNLAYIRQQEAPADRVPQISPDQQRESGLLVPRQAGEQPAATAKRASEVNVDAAYGQPYAVFEGTTLDTVLMNRLDGDAVGPVKVLVSNPLYSHDHQHVLIPDGTIVLGEAKKTGSPGFGQQRRLAVIFHRMLMPDGYSVDLDQFHGLDQIGEEGLKDKVNNHYLEIFGASIALGAISGAAESTQGGSSLTGSGVQVYTNGAAASTSQTATTVLDRFLQISPNITLREGHRVKVYFTQDLLLPAYERHTIPSSF